MKICSITKVPVASPAKAGKAFNVKEKTKSGGATDKGKNTPQKMTNEKKPKAKDVGRLSAIICATTI